MLAKVRYRGYGPTYRATCNIYIVSVQQANLSECKGQKINAIFMSISLIWDYAVMLI